MTVSTKTLHLFTSEYPYGEKSETFIETEIVYLSQYFGTIILYPKTTAQYVRELPENVQVNDFRSKLDYSKKNKILQIARYFYTFSKIVFEEFIDKKKINTFKFLIDYLSEQLIEYNYFKFIKTNKNDVFYDYWFSNATLMLAIAKSKSKITKIIARAHAFDIYDDCWGIVGVPFRITKIKQLDKVFVISQFGIDYIKSKVDKQYYSKLDLSFLGVERFSRENLNKIESKKVIVSCSGVTKRKGVVETINILKRVDLPIHWIHFGYGPEFEMLNTQMNDLPPNITVELKGHITNKEIITFYQTNHIDLFLSLSKSEGIPVSMMEAISFGIQIAAYPVGGVPEIVKKNVTGKLMKQNGREHEIIKDLLENPIENSVILSFYSRNFNAKINYPEFIAKL